MTWGSFYWHELPLIPAWISNHMHSKMWDEIIYPFPNFSDSTIEVWEWISNFIQFYVWYTDIWYKPIMEVYYLSIHTRKRGLRSSIIHRSRWISAGYLTGSLKYPSWVPHPWQAQLMATWISGQSGVHGSPPGEIISVPDLATRWLGWNEVSDLTQVSGEARRERLKLRMG